MKVLFSDGWTSARDIFISLSQPVLSLAMSDQMIDLINLLFNGEIKLLE